MEKKEVLLSIAEDTRRIYFDLVPGEGAAVEVRPTVVRYREKTAEGKLVYEFGGEPAVLLIGTGSEVALCVDAYEALKKEGVAARVVSMPSWELFEAQDPAYRDSVLPPAVTARARVITSSHSNRLSCRNWGRSRNGIFRFPSSAACLPIMPAALHGWRKSLAARR